jgi:prepilin-type N-terminal cleavage/methylation domain-containing protein
MNRLPTLLRGNGGHTLIELSLVLLLIGIASSVALPSMNQYMAESRVDRAIERVASDIAYSRILAIRQSTPVLITFQSGTSYTVTLPSTGATLRTISLAADLPGVSVTPPTANSQLEFDSRGILRSIGTGTLTVTDGQVTDSAALTLAGKVYHAD